MSAFQVGPETFLTLEYEVFDAEGESVGVAEVIGCVFGMGQLLPAVETALDGKTEGEQVRVRLREHDAFGKRKAAAIVEVDRSDFPPDVTPGDRFEAENEQGGVLILQVLDVHEDIVVVDTNHPLAGQAVELALRLLEVRPATRDEMEAAALSLEEDMAESKGPGVEPPPLISPQALLQRR